MIKVENIMIAIYGIATVVVFVIMIFFGGLFDSIHTLFFREISFLISPYSLFEDVTVPLYRLYNVNLFLFSLVLFIRLQNVFAKVGALYLSMSAVTSLLLAYIPMDAILLSRSLNGFTHIMITLLTGFYLLIAMSLFSYSLKRSKHLGMLAKYSFTVNIIILIGGFLTAVFALLSMPEYVGVIQKISIAAFLLWIVLTVISILHSDRRVNYGIKFGKPKSKHQKRRF
jgi:hypothetical protein